MDLHNLEGFCEVFFMLLGHATLHKHVINIDLHISPYIGSEHSGHHPVVGSSRVLQIEWHDFLALEALLGDEGGVLMVYEMHLNLVIYRVGIHKCQQLVPGGSIHQLVNH